MSNIYLHYNLDYTANMPVDCLEKENLYKKIKETLCPFLSNDEILRLKKAWQKDILNRDRIAGPYFSLAVADLRKGREDMKELDNECFKDGIIYDKHNVDLAKCMMIEAAIYDWLIEKKNMPKNITTERIESLMNTIK